MSDERVSSNAQHFWGCPAASSPDYRCDCLRAPRSGSPSNWEALAREYAAERDAANDEIARLRSGLNKGDALRAAAQAAVDAYPHAQSKHMATLALALEATPCAGVSEGVVVGDLRREREEEEQRNANVRAADKASPDVELDSPNFVPQAAKDLAGRDYERINVGRRDGKPAPRTSDASPVIWWGDVGGSRLGWWVSVDPNKRVGTHNMIHGPAIHATDETLRELARKLGFEKVAIERPSSCPSCDDLGCDMLGHRDGCGERASGDAQPEALQPPGTIGSDGTRYHYLKTWTAPWHHLNEGSKTFEWRKHDRDYRVGDVLVLEEYEPTKGILTNRALERHVTYLLPGGTFGVPPGYCVMGLRSEAHVERKTTFTCAQCNAPLSISHVGVRVLTDRIDALLAENEKLRSEAAQPVDLWTPHARALLKRAFNAEIPYGRLVANASALLSDKASTISDGARAALQAAIDWQPGEGAPVYRCACGTVMHATDAHTFDVAPRTADASKASEGGPERIVLGAAIRVVTRHLGVSTHDLNSITRALNGLARERDQTNDENGTAAADRGRREGSLRGDDRPDDGAALSTDSEARDGAGEGGPGGVTPNASAASYPNSISVGTAAFRTQEAEEQAAANLVCLCFPCHSGRPAECERRSVKPYIAQEPGLSPQALEEIERHEILRKRGPDSCTHRIVDYGGDIPVCLNCRAPIACPLCLGRGWHHETLSDDPDDPNEVYCRCEAGDRLQHEEECDDDNQGESNGSADGREGGSEGSRGVDRSEEVSGCEHAPRGRRRRADGAVRVAVGASEAGGPQHGSGDAERAGGARVYDHAAALIGIDTIFAWAMEYQVEIEAPTAAWEALRLRLGGASVPWNETCICGCAPCRLYDRHCGGLSCRQAAPSSSVSYEERAGGWLVGRWNDVLRGRRTPELQASLAALLSEVCLETIAQCKAAHDAGVPWGSPFTRKAGEP